MVFNDKNYIVLNSASTLIWLCTQAALELHTSFNTYDRPDHPSHLVFDLDPDEGQVFEDVADVAADIHETLEALSITDLLRHQVPQGHQIFIPTSARYDYDTARKLNEFFAQYFVQKLSSKVTIERMKKKERGIIIF